MFKLKERLMLSTGGYKDIKRAIFACVLTNILLMIPFGVSLQIISELMKGFTLGEVKWSNIVILFLLGLVGAVIIYFSNKNEYRKCYLTSYREASNTRTRVAEKVRLLPMSFFNRKDLTEITTNIMGDCQTIEHVLSHLIPQLSATGISIALICVILSVFNWVMALAVFISLPVAFAIIYFGKKLELRLSERLVQKKLDAANQIQEYVEGIKEIKSFGLAGRKSKLLDNALKSLKKMSMKLEAGVGIVVTGAQIVVQSGVGLTVFAGTSLLLLGRIDFITMIMFFLIVSRIYGPVLVELTLLAELFHMRVATRRMHELLKADVMTGEDIRLKKFDINLKNVSFKYDENSHETTIKDVNLEIPENGITALVGPSGSGKTTIARLIARFWDANEGSIEIGGIDIKRMNPDSLMNYMSFVFQEVVLFNDTIMNNVKVGNTYASDDEVYAAAKAARCHEFIKNLEDGYDTVLGENGNTLSGGERQRISIARALLKNAPIVMLDEATASLDPENEVLIQEAISNLIEKKTVIVIAHRLRTITDADKIVLLNNGTIEEEGTHDELIMKKGIYNKMYNIQRESAGWII